MAYNATVYGSFDGKECTVFVAEVNEDGKMLRSNAIQFTKYDGTPLYDEYIRLRYPNEDFRIVLDNGKGYRDRIAGLMLPPAYR